MPLASGTFHIEDDGITRLFKKTFLFVQVALCVGQSRAPTDFASGRDIRTCRCASHRDVNVRVDCRKSGGLSDVQAGAGWSGPPVGLRSPGFALGSTNSTRVPATSMTSPGARSAPSAP